MNARDTLLVALPAALVGAGVGYFLASVSESAPRPVAAAAPSPITASRPSNAGTTEPAAPLVASSVEDERVPTEVPVEAPVARVSESELERALDAVTAPAVASRKGAGAITGKVVDESGAPLQGVAVIGARVDSNRAGDPADIGAGPPLDGALEEYLREKAQSWAETRARRRRTLTGADGAFRLDNLDEGSSYSVSAYLEDYVLEADGANYSVSPGQTLTFRGRRVYVIPVELVYESGGEPSEGVVGVARGDDEELYTWTAAEPEIRCIAGRVGVRGFAGLRPAGGWRQGVDSTHGSEEVSIDVVDNAGAPLRLVLKPRRGIRGRVIDHSGVGGRRRMVVRILPTGSGELDESALAASDEYTWLYGDRFDFLDLSPGNYAVGLSNWQEALLAHEVVSVGDGISEIELVVQAPDPEKSLVVRAFGPSGNPLEDLEFRWMVRRGSGSRSGGIQGRRGPDGAYWLQPKADFFEPWPGEATYTLTVQHSELGSREVELEEGQREVNVTMEEPIAIVVVVEGYAGSGYEGKLDVSLEPVVEGEEHEAWRGRNRSRQHREGGFSPAGEARYEGLAPGVWRVGLLVKTGEWQTQTVHSREVRVLSGEKRVKLDLPALYELTVLASGLSAGTRLFLRRTDEAGEVSFGRHYDARVDGSGRAVFQGLVAGEYSLSGEGVASVDVVVPCGEVYLDAEQPDCIRVAIGDTKGALYQAGLRAGDLIIGADGKEFESAPNAWSFLRGEGSVSLIVLRGNERLELSMERIASTANWMEVLGGMLTSASR